MRFNINGQAHELQLDNRTSLLDLLRVRAILSVQPIDHDGFQCGYCTPGQICSAIGMVAELRRGVPSVLTHDLKDRTIKLTRDELRERMSGNLCRCGAHNGIVDAIETLYEEAAE